MAQADARTAAARIDEALAGFAASPDPRAMERAEDLVRTLMDFYGEAVGRLVDLLNGTPNGQEALRRVADDRAVSGLLVLHDLHPASTAERVAQALERVRPYLGSHAGDVELIGVDDGVVRLRLIGSCDGCPSSSATVTNAIERAIDEIAPEVSRVEVEGAVPALTVNGPGGRTLLPVLGSSR